MQQWEYLTVVFDGANRELRPRWVDDKELPDWKKGPTRYEYLNQLGNQGWELAATSATLYTFKRPKS